MWRGKRLKQKDAKGGKMVELEHTGAVNTSTSPSVGYQYADGSTNTIRPTAMIYPNGRVLNMSYGAAGGTDDALSRIAGLIDNDGVTHLVDYTRIGVGTFVQATYPQPNIRYDLINGSGADPYSGLDQFDRVVDCRWWNITTTTDVERRRSKVSGTSVLATLALASVNRLLLEFAARARKRCTEPIRLFQHENTTWLDPHRRRLARQQHGRRH